MATRNTAVLDKANDVHPGAPSLRLRSTASNTEFRQASFQTSPPSASGEGYRSPELDRHSHDDYRIALVPHDNPAHPDDSGFESATATRILFLPFTWRELLDRMRGEQNFPSSTVQEISARFGEVCVNFMKMEVRRSQKAVVLTYQQFKLLRFFLQNPQRVLSRDELLNEVWGYNHYPSTRTVDNHVWMLRRKLEAKPASPVHFVTVQRIGYKFVP